MTQWHQQSIRFILIGLASNLALFIFYLLITSLGSSPKLAMTALFVVGTIQTFIFNKRWTFAHQGFLQASFLKYATIYSFAYLLNLMTLLIFVDHFGYPHQAVQGATILSLASILFLLQKFWVFRAPDIAPTTRI